MPRLEQQPPEDFRRVLREKALNHSLFYLKLSAGVEPEKARAAAPAQSHAQRRASASGLVSAATHARLRHAQPRVSELLRRFEPAPMQYLRIPRAATPPEDITSSDDDDRAAVRRRSRDLSDDSAVELEPRPRRHSHPRDLTPPPGAPSPRRERTLVEAHVVQLGRRGSEGSDGSEARGRCVRTPSVVVSDYSDGVVVGASAEEAAWLRARSLSADSACSSCSTLSSRDDEEFEPQRYLKDHKHRMTGTFGVLSDLRSAAGSGRTCRSQKSIVEESIEYFNALEAKPMSLYSSYTKYSVKIIFRKFTFSKIVKFTYL